MKETCELIFLTSLGRNRIMTVAEPRSGLTGTTATNAASMIMASNPFNAEIGTLEKLLKATHVTVTRKALV
jgi:hypothetical protein